MDILVGADNVIPQCIPTVPSLPPINYIPRNPAVAVFAANPVKKKKPSKQVRFPPGNPHGLLTFNRMVKMKIVDRLSCYVVGFRKCDSPKKHYSKHENFGQFGTITSMRFIKSTDPLEIYVRFETTESAQAAIDWCRDLGMDADFGYNKYCFKFLCKKNCTSNCPNRHTWCNNPADIVPRHSEGNLLSRLTQTPRRKQQQFAIAEKLKKQIEAQNRYIDDLLIENRQLQAENARLKSIVLSTKCASCIGSDHVQNVSEFSEWTTNYPVLPYSDSVRTSDIVDKVITEFDGSGSGNGSGSDECKK